MIYAAQGKRAEALQIIKELEEILVRPRPRTLARA
jgi:hypothetical protein